MKDLVNIIIAEKRTLLRGYTLSLLLILPFIILITLLQNGFALAAVADNLPKDTMYALLFSLVIVIASVLHNYNNLVRRKRIFDLPAFEKINFYGRLDGVGSVVKELETFLLGKAGDYYFRINIVDAELKNFKIEIIPLIDFSENENLKNKLKKEYGFKEDLVLGKKFKIKEQELYDENKILEKLLDINNLLKELGAKPLEFDESILDE